MSSPRSSGAPVCSLTVGVAAIAFGLLVGGTMGILAGFLRGRTDSAISAFFVVMLAFPPLVLAILITSTLEREADLDRADPGHPGGRARGSTGPRQHAGLVRA